MACGTQGPPVGDASPDAGPAAADARGFRDAAPLPDGAPLRACQAEVAATAPLELPDRATTESRLDVGLPSSARVEHVTVTVDVAHAYPRDLELTLVSPAGTAVRLATRLGTGDGYRDTVFSDDAAAAIADGAGSFFGSYRPEERLARFAGEVAAGAWTLRVADVTLGDSGRLFGWSLRVDACPPPTCATTTLSLSRDAPFGSLGPTTFFAVTDPGRVSAARVGVSLTYPFAEDLGLRLWSPRGTVVDLSSGNGGLGASYLETVFDDAAAQSVLEGVAPFTGRFRPEERLRKVAGEAAAGSWIVEVGLVDGPWASGDELVVTKASLELDVCPP